MLRKIIQIATVPMRSIPDSTGTRHCYSVLYALCNDGSLWEQDSDTGRWRRMDTNRVEQEED